MDRSLQHAFDAEEVMAYLDGESDRQRAAALAGHLEHCAECQDVAKELRLLSGRMMNFEIETAPANIAASIVAELNSPTKREPVKPRNSIFGVLAKGRQFAGNRKVWALAGGFAIVLVVVALTPNLRSLREASNINSARHYEPSQPVTPESKEAPGSYQSWMQGDGAGLRRAQQAMMSENMVSTSAAQSAAKPSPPPPQEEKPQALESVGPMIVQTASLNIVAKNYAEASAGIEKQAKARGGYVEKLDAKAQTGNSRELSIALRIPAKQLDGFLADVRQLGHVEQESQSNEEVSAEYVDLQARLRSAQATERRLIELLATRTGRLEDVLEVERELARVRGEIESMQGQSAVLVHQVSYATVQVALREEYHERLQSDSTGMKLWNASITGVQNLTDGVVGLLIFILNYGLAILFWAAMIAVPSWLSWRRFRSRRTAQS